MYGTHRESLATFMNTCYMIALVIVVLMWKPYFSALGHVFPSFLFLLSMNTTCSINMNRIDYINCRLKLYIDLKIIHTKKVRHTKLEKGMAIRMINKER
jgi:hypothetical protein